MKISEIKLTDLKQINHPKGDIFHALKSSEIQSFQFGEAYFSFIIMNEVKGWKLHKEMILNLIVPIGEIEFVIYDEINNKFKNILIGDSNYKRLTIPPGLWVAFKGMKKNNMLLNIANIEHNPKESINKDLSEINYDWS